MILDIITGGVKLISGLVGGDLGKKLKDVSAELTDKSKSDPELRALIQTHEAEMTRMLLADNEGARQLIREEGKSEHAYTRNVRPTFMYMCIFIMALTFLVPLIGGYISQGFMQVGSDGVWRMVTIVYPELPKEVYYLFGTAFLGYAGLRTAEKKGMDLPFANSSRKK